MPSLYVDNLIGDDNNNGDQNNPVKSLSRAIQLIHEQNLENTDIWINETEYSYGFKYGIKIEHTSSFPLVSHNAVTITINGIGAPVFEIQCKEISSLNANTGIYLIGKGIGLSSSLRVAFKSIVFRARTESQTTRNNYLFCAQNTQLDIHNCLLQDFSDNKLISNYFWDKSTINIQNTGIKNFNVGLILEDINEAIIEKTIIAENNIGLQNNTNADDVFNLNDSLFLDNNKSILLKSGSGSLARCSSISQEIDFDLSLSDNLFLNFAYIYYNKGAWIHPQNSEFQESFDSSESTGLLKPRSFFEQQKAVFTEKSFVGNYTPTLEIDSHRVGFILENPLDLGFPQTVYDQFWVKWSESGGYSKGIDYGSFTVLFVDPASGDDANNGTTDQPLKTLPAAINMLTSITSSKVLIYAKPYAYNYGFEINTYVLPVHIKELYFIGNNNILHITHSNICLSEDQNIIFVNWRLWNFDWKQEFKKWSVEFNKSPLDSNITNQHVVFYQCKTYIEFTIESSINLIFYQCYMDNLCLHGPAQIFNSHIRFANRISIKYSNDAYIVYLTKLIQAPENNQISKILNSRLVSAFFTGIQKCENNVFSMPGSVSYSIDTGVYTRNITTATVYDNSNYVTYINNNIAVKRKILIGTQHRDILAIQLDDIRNSNIEPASPVFFTADYDDPTSPEGQIFLETDVASQYFLTPLIKDWFIENILNSDENVYSKIYNEDVFAIESPKTYALISSISDIDDIVRQSNPPDVIEFLPPDASEIGSLILNTKIVGINSIFINSISLTTAVKANALNYLILNTIISSKNKSSLILDTVLTYRHDYNIKLDTVVKGIGYLYVDYNIGNDTYSGSANAPLKTLGEAFRRAKDFDTIILKNGMHYVDSSLPPFDGTTQLSILNPNGLATLVFDKINLNTLNNSTAAFLFQGVNIQLMNFERKKWSYFENVNITFNRCDFIGNQALRIIGIGSNTTLHVQNCKISQAYNAFITSPSSSNSNIAILNSTFERITGYILRLYKSSYYTCLIGYNKIIDSHQPISFFESFNNTIDINIFHNTIVNASVAIDIAKDPYNLTFPFLNIDDNIFYNCEFGALLPEEYRYLLGAHNIEYTPHSSPQSLDPYIIDFDSTSNTFLNVAHFSPAVNNASDGTFIGASQSFVQLLFNQVTLDSRARGYDFNYLRIETQCLGYSYGELTMDTAIDIDLEVTQISMDTVIKGYVSTSAITLDTKALVLDKSYIVLSSMAVSLGTSYTKLSTRALSIDISNISLTTQCQGGDINRTRAPLYSVTINGQAVRLNPHGLFEFDASSLNVGPNQLVFEAIDHAGNVATLVKTITYDPNPPSISLDKSSYTENRYTNSYMLTGIVEDTAVGSGVDKVIISANGRNYLANIVGNRWEAAVDSLVDGENTIQMRASDIVGNELVTEDTLFFDQHPPILEIDENISSKYIKGVVKDPFPSSGLLSLSIDNKTANIQNNGQFSVLVDTLKAGNNIINIIAKDKAGNESNIQKNIFLNLFSVNVKLLGSQYINNKTLIGQFNYLGDSLPVKELLVDGISANFDENGYFSVFDTNLNEGVNEVLIELKGDGGNTSTYSFIVYYDIHDPYGEITSPSIFNSKKITGTWKIFGVAPIHTILVNGVEATIYKNGTWEVEIEEITPNLNKITAIFITSANNTFTTHKWINFDFEPPRALALLTNTAIQLQVVLNKGIIEDARSIDPRNYRIFSPSSNVNAFIEGETISRGVDQPDIFTVDDKRDYYINYYPVADPTLKYFNLHTGHTMYELCNIVLDQNKDYFIEGETGKVNFTQSGVKKIAGKSVFATYWPAVAAKVLKVEFLPEISIEDERAKITTVSTKPDYLLYGKTELQLEDISSILHFEDDVTKLLFVDIENKLYIGSKDVFNGIQIVMDTPGQYRNLNLEFLRNDGVWAPLVFEDNTHSFYTSGEINFAAPPNWISTIINNHDCYWIRINTTLPPISPGKVDKIAIKVLKPLQTDSVYRYKIDVNYFPIIDVQRIRNIYSGEEYTPVYIGSDYIEIEGPFLLPSDINAISVDYRYGRNIITLSTEMQIAKELYSLYLKNIKDYAGNELQDINIPYVCEYKHGEILNNMLDNLTNYFNKYAKIFRSVRYED